MRGAAGLEDQDCGDARRGSSICGAWSSYGLPAGSSEYSATAGVTSLPYESTFPSVAESRDAATAVFDKDDRLAFTIFKEQRIEVPLSEVSPYLTKAITSIEDQRFYDHHGFDLVRIVSAAMTNLRHGRRAQGGSTITQQLARQ